MRCERLQRSLHVDPGDCSSALVRGTQVFGLRSILKCPEFAFAFAAGDYAQRFVAGNLSAPRQRRLRCAARMTAAPGAGHSFLRRFLGVGWLAQDAQGLGLGSPSDQRPVPMI